MTIQLTGYSISAYCLVLLHVLKELGLSYEFTQPNSFEEIKTPEYLATKHPFGKIPSLNDDGFQIYETRAIARYLVKKYQGKLVGQLVFAKRRGNEPDLKIINEAREELEKVLDVYEKLLEDKDYLTGEFSLADLLHIPLTNYAIKAGENDLWNKRPNVSRWWKNISERECWKNILNEYTLA
ncbi:unnamed protein product [Rhizophagus irregularis]|uniref:glutathione transferase n=1 Tax=Rhizophagus irregularis TaxID=588596 RepID=A0A915Z7W7_9GLOM|nr:unnamed protein product [Rhizophagus irregularis]